MVHGTMAFSKIQLRRQRAGDVIFRLFHRCIQIHPLRKVGSDGAGKRAAGAVGVGIVDPSSPEPLEGSVSEKQVICVVQIMSALFPQLLRDASDQVGR